MLLKNMVHSVLFMIIFGLYVYPYSSDIKTNVCALYFIEYWVGEKI